MQLPNWLTEEEKPSRYFSKTQQRGGFVEKTLVGIAKVIETSIFSEQYASRRGLLQRIDPRVKLISILSLLTVVNILQNVAILFGVYVFLLILAGFSRIEVQFFIKRVWLFIPLFAGLIAFPAMFNVFTPGDVIYSIVRFEKTITFWGYSFDEIALTRQGVNGAIFFVLRVATSVSLAVLLTLTTHWNDLMKSLHSLGVPNVFILVLSMTYQYIFLLLRLVQDMHLAKRSRTIQYKKGLLDNKGDRQWVASRIGVLLRRSFGLIDEIQMAMLARGFHNEIKILTPFKARKIDLIWGLLIIAVIAAVIGLNSGQYLSQTLV